MKTSALMSAGSATNSSGVATSAVKKNFSVAFIMSDSISKEAKKSSDSTEKSENDDDLNQSRSKKQKLDYSDIDESETDEKPRTHSHAHSHPHKHAFSKLKKSHHSQKRALKSSKLNDQASEEESGAENNVSSSSSPSSSPPTSIENNLMQNLAAHQFAQDTQAYLKANPFGGSFINGYQHVAPHQQHPYQYMFENVQQKMQQQQSSHQIGLLQTVPNTMLG